MLAHELHVAQSKVDSAEAQLLELQEAYVLADQRTQQAKAKQALMEAQVR